MQNKKIIRITTIPHSFRNLLSGQMKFMTQHGFELIAVSSPDDVLEEVGKLNGVRTFALKMTRTITPIHDLIAVYKLVVFLKREKPFIVHTHTPKAGLVGMLAAKLAGVPHRLHTVAGLPLLVTSGFKRTLLDVVEKLTYYCATRVYPNSRGLDAIIKANNYTSASKLKVIGKGSSNGIDTSYFDKTIISEEQKATLKHSFGITEDDFVFLYVGRLVKDKGINELVASFDQLNKAFSKSKLLLVGLHENQLNPLSELTEQTLQHNSNIILTGYQNDVRPFFAIANVFVFPSYREGFPNVVMQSCAMSVATIATDINGCNEIIQEGSNGFLVPPQNEKLLYEKMLFLYNNPAVRKSMADNSRLKIVDDYERIHFWNEMLKEYKSL